MIREAKMTLLAAFALICVLRGLARPLSMDDYEHDTFL
jgi:hypothetical protein